MSRISANHITFGEKTQHSRQTQHHIIIIINLQKISNINLSKKKLFLSILASTQNLKENKFENVNQKLIPFLTWATNSSFSCPTFKGNKTRFFILQYLLKFNCLLLLLVVFQYKTNIYSLKQF